MQRVCLALAQNFEGRLEHVGIDRVGFREPPLEFQGGSMIAHGRDAHPQAVEVSERASGDARRH
jgi:hypothetical protein